MKRFIFAILAVALLSVPAAVLADDNGPPAPTPQMQAAFQNLEQAHARVEQLHSQARLAMLNTLSLAHRTLLAQIVGQLAISPNPDVNAAARTLDAALSQSEGRSILSIASSLESQSRQIMDAAHQQLMNAGPPMGSASGQGMGHPMFVHREIGGPEKQVTDPGLLLLGMSVHGIEPPGMNETYHMILKRQDNVQGP